MSKYWNLFWKFRKLQLMRMMEYRGDFIFWSFISVMWTVFSFFFFTLLFNITDQIGGWTPDELYLFLGVYMMVDSLTWSFFAQNMWEYKKSIYDGSLNTHLLRPVHPIFIILTQRNSFDNIPRFFIGLLVVVASLYNMQITPTIFQTLTFTTLFITSCIFLYTGWFFFTTFAFWFERFDNITEIMPAFRKVYEYPNEIYSKLASLLVHIIFPLALVINLPSETLLGRPNPSYIVYFVIFTIIFATIAIKFFYFSIKKYSSIGN